MLSIVDINESGGWRRLFFKRRIPFDSVFIFCSANFLRGFLITHVTAQDEQDGQEKNEGKVKRTSRHVTLQSEAAALNARDMMRRIKIKIVSFITFISFDASANGAHTSAAMLPLGLLLGVQGNHGARIRGDARTINYISVLSYAAGYILLRLTLHALYVRVILWNTLVPHFARDTLLQKK